MNLTELFEVQLSQKLQSDPEILNSTEASYQLEIDENIFKLDLKSGRQIKAGALEKPDCVIKMSETTFSKMCDGKLNVALALATRKIKVSGDLMLFTKLRELFK